MHIQIGPESFGIVIHGILFYLCFDDNLYVIYCLLWRYALLIFPFVVLLSFSYCYWNFLNLCRKFPLDVYVYSKIDHNTLLYQIVRGARILYLDEAELYAWKLKLGVSMLRELS